MDLVRASALGFTLAAAKTLTALLRVVDGAGGALASPFSPLALLHQDLWVALALGLLGAAASFAAGARAERPLWGLYAAIVIYAALNVPIARVFGTPLTLQLLRGTGGALADSIADSVTGANVAVMLLVLGVGAGAPFLLARLHPGRGAVVRMLVVGALVLLAGPFAAARMETQGVHRNAVVILLATALEARGSTARPADRPELLPEGAALPLDHLRGAAAGRHVVLVVLESTPASALAPYGAARDPMPNLTRLASQSLRFESAYTTYPESIKQLWALLCATAPAAHTEAAAYASTVLGCDALPAGLAAAGYRTGLFHSGRFAYLGMKHVVEGRGFGTLEDAGSIGGRHVSSFGCDEQATVARLLGFVDETKPGQRFFAAYLPIAGHHPYAAPGRAPGPFGEGSPRDRFLGDLFAADAALGALREGLRRRGLDGKTLWVILGDHGEAFFEHPGNFAHSLFLYEENVRVPLFVAIPGVLGQALSVPQMASAIDVPPTIVDLLGLEAPESWQGRSLLEGRPRIARFFTDYAETQLGLRDGRWKLIHNVDSGRSRLFDLTADPTEQRDVAAAHAERVAMYRRSLAAWAAAQRARVRGAP